MLDSNSIFNQLQAQGERLTIQRRLVIEALCSNDQHLTINAIRRHITAKNNAPDLSEVTVYRILQWLKNLHLVCQTDMGQMGIAYEWVGDPPHHHLICLECGYVTDIDDNLFEELRKKLRQEYDFAPRIEHMAIYGRCRGCMKT